MIEFMLSLEKFLSTTEPGIKGQALTWRMKGPVAPLTELTALLLLDSLMQSRFVAV